MTKLSPAAQAVLNAYASALLTEKYATSGRIEIAVAAAIRVTADQLSDEMIVVGEGFKGLMRDDWSIIHTEDLLAIADEIEALQT